MSRVPAWSAWGLVALLALAGLGATLAPPAPAEDAPTIVVGQPRIGDLVMYLSSGFDAWDETGGAFDGNESYADWREWRAIDAIERTPDQSGALSDAVRIATRWEADAMLGRPPSAAELLRRWTNGDARSIDLASRGLARLERLRTSTDPTVEVEHRVQTFRPSFYDAPWYTMFGVAPLTPLALSGTTLRLGEEIAVPDEKLPRPGSTFQSRTDGDVVVQEARAKARVTEVDIIDGAQALGVRFEIVYRYATQGGSGQVEGRDEWTDWYVAGFAYPVRTEAYYDSWSKTTDWEGHDWGEYRAHVEGFAPGEVPVPWTAPPGDGAPVALTWSDPSTPFPEGGAGWRAAFAPEDAIAAIEEDPALARLAAWKLSNPGWVVAGMRMRPGPIALGLVRPPGWEDATHWDVTFAAPEGRTAHVATTMRLADGRTLQADQGTFALADNAVFSAADLPEHQVDFATIDRMWERAARRETYAAGPNAVGWGMYGFQDPETPVGLHSGACVGRPCLQTAWYGWREASSADPATLTIGESVAVDVASGNLVMAQSWDRVVDPVQVLPQFLPPQAESAPPPPRFGFAAYAAGGSLLALLALAYAWPLVKFSATAAWVSAYSRLRKGALLENAVRERLVALIGQDAGISPPTLQKATGAGWSTVVYHIGVLEKNGVIRTVIDGRHKRCFLAGTFDPASMRREALLRQPKTRDALEIIRGCPGIDRSTLAKELGVSTPGALWHVQRLERAGLITRAREGRVVRYQAASGNTSLAPPALA